MTKIELEKKIKEVESLLSMESAESTAWSKTNSSNYEMSKILVSSRQKQLDELITKLTELQE